MPHLMLELANGFKKRLALDVSHGAAHLYDGNPGVHICEIAV